jgi:hypothetical protein
MKEREKVKIHNTPYFAEVWKSDVSDIKMKHPNKEIYVCFNTECDLDTLKDNESVCFGDGEHYYFVLTNKLTKAQP